MANLMNKLSKNKPIQRFIISLKTPQHQQQQQQQVLKLTPSLIPQETQHFSLTKPQFLNNRNFFFNPKTPDNAKSTEPLKLYPNFPFGCLLNPINSAGFDPLEAVEVKDEDAGKVWADSVKKKRKKKMNKHKYKKLRKRLRRKT